MKQDIVYVTWSERTEDDPENRAYTLSTNPQREGWETDSGCYGYGLSKARAEFFAKAINEYLKSHPTEVIPG